jgi:signal transduction histidine kinase
VATSREFLTYVHRVLKLLKEGAYDWIDPEGTSFTDPAELEVISALADIQAEMQEVCRQAKVIAAGDYSAEIAPRSDKDELGITLFNTSRMLQEREAGLLKATVLLEERQKDLETLLYVTSHDLREPLRTLQNFSRLVNDRYADKLDDKGQDFLRRIVRGADRLDRLVEDVLTLSQAQRLVEPNQWLEARTIVNDVLERLENKIRESGAEVRVADGLPRLYVDKTWAVQAVYNLVANALKFTREGQPPEIEIDTYHPRAGVGAVGIVVRDRGLGVCAEHRERIFGLFRRAVDRDVDGTGAGLAIVRQIARRHGGDVWVEGRQGGGSEFTITFSVPKEQQNDPAET